MSQPMGPLPDTELVFYLNHDTARWTEYRSRPAVLSDGDLELYDADQMRAYAAQEVAAAVKAERERLTQELSDKAEEAESVDRAIAAGLREAVAAIRAKDTP